MLRITSLLCRTLPHYHLHFPSAQYNVTEVKGKTQFTVRPTVRDHCLGVSK